ncbi:MAG: hypothetical protein H0V93_03675 [Euzebyales bacterium]|nr:hypothetical protein [Euzebyales bacterium]
MSGSLGVMAIVLLETAVGGSVVLWASGVYGNVRRGFFLLAGITLAFCAWGAWAVTGSAVEQAAAVGPAGDPTVAAVTGPAGARMLVALAIFAGLMIAWQVLLLIRDGALARGVGLLAAIAGVVALVTFGLARGLDPAFAIAELALGALFLGSTLHGLLLGHWYLVERRLPNTHMIRSSWFYVAGVVASAVALALSARNPAPDVTAVASPLLAIPGFSLLLGAGLVAICALIAGFVWKLAQEGGRSIQAATGMFYLAVIMAFSAELAAKFRYFSPAS